jgi:hypothetical protein
LPLSPCVANACPFDLSYRPDCRKARASMADDAVILFIENHNQDAEARRDKG